MKIRKLVSYYLLWNIIWSPAMFIFFMLSVMMYDSGVPETLFSHLMVVSFVLVIFLIPSFALISKAKKSLYENKNIEVSYKESYIIGTIITLIPAVFFTVVHINPSNFIEIISAVITPLILILIFVFINYLYNTNSKINITLKKIGKTIGFAYIALLILSMIINQITMYLPY